MNRVRLERNADLAALSTFRLPARTAELIAIDHPEQIETLPRDDLPTLILGGGSNTVFLADWPGRILLNRLRGMRVEPATDDTVKVHAAAGENWHALVRWCLDRNLHGIENLIMIPGSVGAAPMQNIGAYGMELAESLVSVRAWDWQEGKMVELAAAECRLGYRDSRFKSDQPGRFLITEVCLRLKRAFVPVTAYRSLADELHRVGHDRPEPRQLSAAVMRLRRHRLPDPARLPNAGSFFKNPVVDAALADSLLQDWPALPHWPMADGQVKLAAGWMIERLGFRGHRIGDAGVYHNHALVLVNHGQATAGELKELISRITTAVDSEFGITLEPEPRLIG
jgi:UDP-N-acetylmuramate dehydrogenase